MANSLNLRPQGGLPGDIEPNPRQLYAVSTRSGLQLEELAPKKRNNEGSAKEKKVEEVVKRSNIEALLLKRSYHLRFHKHQKIRIKMNALVSFSLSLFK